jgi:long-chain acyl-CoA synthetase
MTPQGATAQTAPTAELQTVQRDTIARLFITAVDRHDRPDALQYKQTGMWRSISHREVEERVTRLAAALGEMGIGRGDRVGLLSENRPEWALVDFAALGIGAADVPIYPTLPPNQIAYILKDSGAKAIFVSTVEQLEKIQEIRGELPELEQVVVFDDPGGAQNVITLHDALERGRQAIDAGTAPSFREQADEVGRDDLATLIYTSGTTGDPKGVMLTHYNLASNVAGTQQHRVIDVSPGEVALSFLPLSHVFERMVDYYYWDAGVSIAYAESIDKVAENLQEVSPHYMVSVPRLFDKIYTKVMGATGIKKKLVMWAKNAGETVVDREFAGEPVSAVERLQYRLADKLVFSKLREKTGGRLRAAISGGAPLSGDVARFFFAAGLPVYEGYGLTETSPVLTANKPGKVRLGTVGTPIPGVEVRLSEEGEILTRGPQIMKGYWQNEEATREVIDEDGWFHTGDVGEIDDDGFLRISDRIKNILVTAGGKNVAPAPIENAAAMSPYVAQVVMLGDRRAFPSLLVVPDFENLNVWAAEQGMDTSDPEALAKHEKVRELLEKETLGRLEAFARYETPKKIAIVSEEFTVESGILTPTMKVKRRVVEDRYSDLIEGIYSES